MVAWLVGCCAVMLLASGCRSDADAPATVLEVRDRSALFCTERGMETLELADDLVGKLVDGDDVWLELEGGVVTAIESRSSGSTATCTRSESNEPVTPDPDVTPIAVPTPVPD